MDDFDPRSRFFGRGSCDHEDCSIGYVYTHRTTEELDIMAFEIVAGKLTNQGVWHTDRVVFELDDWATAVDIASKLEPVCPVNVPHYLVVSTTTGRVWDDGHELRFDADGRAV